MARDTVPEDVRARALAAGRADEDPVSLVPGSFEIGYVLEDGSAHRVALTDAWAVRLEATAPVRRFYSRKAQRHLPGHWWSATDGVHVGYESWLERDYGSADQFRFGREADGPPAAPWGWEDLNLWLVLRQRGQVAQARH